jgi:hypothetical protein
MPAASTFRVALECGRTWTFATALDWPGWCRRAKTAAGPPAAIEALLDYADRYAEVLRAAGLLGARKAFPPGQPEIVGSVPGNATTDFGAPGVPGPWDEDPLDAKEKRRHIELLQACWSAFDRVVTDSASTLVRGPRGGGRDRDQIVEHVRDAERAYARKFGVKLPPRTPWPEQRQAIAEGIVEMTEVGGDAESWPTRYLINRTAWHVLDHAWEIEDKQP